MKPMDIWNSLDLRWREALCRLRGHRWSGYLPVTICERCGKTDHEVARDG